MDVVKNKINIVDARKNDLLKEMFFEQHIGLVYKVAHKLSNLNMELDDRIGFGHIGFMKAFNTFDVNLPYAFSTYAVKCIMNEVLYENRRVMYSREYRDRHQSLDKAIGNIKSDGNELTLQETIAIKESEYSQDDFDAIISVYNKFVEIYSEKEPRLIQIFNMFIFENKTTAEIAKAFGFNQAHGSRLATKSVNAIQEIAIELDVIECFNKYYKKTPSKQHNDNKNRENKIKQKALYVILNYPELDVKEIGKIINWSTMKIGLLRRSYTKGTFTLPPDDSIKEKVEEYLEKKKIYA